MIKFLVSVALRYVQLYLFSLRYCWIACVYIQFPRTVCLTVCVEYCVCARLTIYNIYIFPAGHPHHSPLHKDLQLEQRQHVLPHHHRKPGPRQQAAVWNLPGEPLSLILCWWTNMQGRRCTTPVRISRTSFSFGTFRSTVALCHECNMTQCYSARRPKTVSETPLRLSSRCEFTLWVVSCFEVRKEPGF